MSPRVFQALLALCAAIAACGQEAAPGALGEGHPAAGTGEPREIVPGIVRPDARFEVAPRVGERFPDVEIHDAEGRPVRIRELASRKPYTVLSLGCLT